MKKQLEWYNDVVMNTPNTTAEETPLQTAKLSLYPMLHRAVRFAVIQHSGQDRKYSGVPYICHPLAVMEIVREVTEDEAMLCAAVLHDVVEDTTALDTHVRQNFGDSVADLVYWLTDQSKPEDGNRKARKEIDRQHTAEAPARAKTIKLADLIHNTESITKSDPDFARVYMKEKERLLEVLTDGDETLWTRAHNALSDYQNELLQDALK